MKTKKLLFIVSIFVTFITLRAQTYPPATQWAVCIGGSANEVLNCLQETDDGNYILAGVSDYEGFHANGFDYWIVKINPEGGIIWQKNYGGNADDEASCIRQTKDGGYIIAGYSNSIDGNVTGNHGGYDYWIVKIDSIGNLLWQKSLGGSGDDFAYSIQQTTDDDYIIAGYSNSNDGQLLGRRDSSGINDYWVVKIDTIGNLIWQKSYGGGSGNIANSINLTNDGGFIVAGYNSSNGGDVTGNHGGYDYWIVKLDAIGDLQWQKSFGGSANDEAFSAIQTYDNGYIVAGFSNSDDGQVAGNHGSGDIWIVKLNNGGNILWSKCYGGSQDDEESSIMQTSDNGYIIGAISKSVDGDVTINRGMYDVWAFKLDSMGTLQWEKTYGGSGEDGTANILSTKDGGYIVGASTNSTDDDVVGNHGQFDYWVIKLGSESAVQEQGLVIDSASLQNYPNPFSSLTTISYNVPKEAQVTVKIYNALGEILTSLINTRQAQGRYSIPFNDSKLSPGTYFVRFTCGNVVMTKPMVIVK